MTRYANPYVAGVGLGLVLLAAFVITGRGLGASGAFAATAAGVTRAIDPARGDASPYFANYVAGAGPCFRHLHGRRGHGRRRQDVPRHRQQHA